MTFPVRLLEPGEFTTTWRGFWESSWEVWPLEITWRRGLGAACWGQGWFRKGVNKPGGGVVGGEGKERPGNMAGAGIVGPMPLHFATNHTSHICCLSDLAPLPTPIFPSCRDVFASDQGKIYALSSQLWEAFVLQLNWKLLAVINYRSCALCPLWLGVGAPLSWSPGWVRVAWVPCFPRLLSSILTNPGIPPSHPPWGTPGNACCSVPLG